MRFCDLFISYKIGLKEIKSTVPFTKLPLYRKIAVIATFAITISSVTLLLLRLLMAGLITLLVGIISLIIFFIIDSRKRNLKIMLKDHYAPYSEKRMNMVINTLQNYKIDIHNFDSIDLLIEEAQNARIQSDYLAPLKTPIKILSAVIIPIVAYVTRKIGDTASQDEMIIMALQLIALTLAIFSVICALIPTVKDILYYDYNKYNELIYDLRQIKLFYAQGNCTSSNKIHKG